MVFRCMNPVHSNRIDREMNRLLSSFLGEPAQRSTAKRPVPANVWEQDDSWLLEMELPGVAPEHVEVTVVDNELTVSVERPEAEEEGVAYFRRERPRGSFTRALQLPGAVDAERVEAALVHGVLTVTLPKSEGSRRRKIQVNGGDQAGS